MDLDQAPLLRIIASSVRSQVKVTRQLSLNGCTLPQTSHDAAFARGIVDQANPVHGPRALHCIVVHYNGLLSLVFNCILMRSNALCRHTCCVAMRCTVLLICFALFFFGFRFVWCITPKCPVALFFASPSNVLLGLALQPHCLAVACIAVLCTISLLLICVASMRLALLWIVAPLPALCQYLKEV